MALLASEQKDNVPDHKVHKDTICLSPGDLIACLEELICVVSHACANVKSKIGLYRFVI